MKSFCRIVAPHFVAGIDLQDGVVTKAAPIVRYMLGWGAESVQRYLDEHEWRGDWTYQIEMGDGGLTA
jgi:hypothetical protein